MTTWSYSSLSLFDQCPKKYYHLRVVKDIVEPLSEAIYYGLEMHKAAELFIRDNIPLPEKFIRFSNMLTTLKNIPGDKLCEYEMGVMYKEGKLEACGFNDENRYWRGIADLLIVNHETKEARLVDYKTGKNSKYADTKQLKLLAAATFLHFPDIVLVKAGLLFVVSEDFIREQFSADKDTPTKLFEPFHPIVNQLEQCFETRVWNPKRNFSCKAWCPVLECSHNGRG